MQIPESVTCRSCFRVVMAGDAVSYTPVRGRLIVERGYCLCPAEEAAGGLPTGSSPRVSG
ncbi:hypothetical protein GCM10014719_43300 [Planomonospora parontospora subsp. antibiotica]|nr:hypothetical protein GCM10014719_43300 [Planomonospora parontospora subsp. antibiotica]GII17575.1 hypothetical protein Ppa05_43010 [Planomonospora parontospora subsp. antibiotica]